MGPAVTPATKFTLPYSIQVADRRIHDAEERGTETMTVAQILQRSSNVGAVTIARTLLGETRLKRWIKRKLLHNFQTAYVDVLSRQQSAFNRHIINALAELADAQEQLGHALRTQSPGGEWKRLRRRQRRLVRQLARLQGVVTAPPEESPT